MQDKLEKLYKECINELKSIGIDIDNSKIIGDIDIKTSKRAKKRYGVCKNEEPDENSKYIFKRKIHFLKFKKHHIEISNWVLDLNDNIIKNTIMHELIHCMPNCNNHGSEFKKYARFINKKLGYNISRLGNKKEDYKLSNLEYLDENEKKFKYTIICENCKTLFYRQRLTKNFLKRYRCGICKGKLKFT